ncbi:MAG: hypothetical protein KDA89_02965 [Planctomycetaceae bacterium]|nr:hypothetical protein [Planctomycetaceae bacterium]
MTGSWSAVGLWDRVQELSADDAVVSLQTEDVIQAVTELAAIEDVG